MSNNIPQGAALDSNTQHKRALILPGGGLRLSYAAGALLELFNHGLTFHLMDGTSGGSLNLAMLLSGLDAETMCERWRSLRMLDTLALRSLKDSFKDPSFVAAGSAEGFRKKVFPHLGIDFQRIRATQGVQATFNVCNFDQKTNQVIRHQDMSEDFLVAGMSLPGAFPPVKIDGVTYLDSGFIQDANLLDAVKSGANELWLIWIMGNIPRYRSGLLNCYVQMLEMSANGALIKEILQINDINQRIAQGETVYGHSQPIRLHLIKPERVLPLDSALYTGQITHARLIEMGRADARQYLNNLPPEGVPLEPGVLSMTEQNPGLFFKETMTGGFALGTDDTAAGKASGDRNHTPLAMHAEVTIDDMERFIEEAEHPGQLSGTIDFDPFGSDIPSHSGVFNLFSPTDNPDLKLMVYELGFEHDGKQYYLAGKKEVRDDPGFDLWSDTTTLYTQLHEGTDKSGPVVGAGILTLGVTDLMRLVSTMNVINADSSVDKVSTIAKFGQFFLGQLWDSYAKHVV